MKSILRLGFSIMLVAVFLPTANAAENAFTTSGGSSPGKGIKYKKNGVPYFSVTKKLTVIPKFSIGEVPSVRISDPKSIVYISPVPNQIKKFEWGERPKNLEIKPLLKSTFMRANKALIAAKIDPKFKAPVVPELVLIADPEINEAKVSEKDIRKMNPTEEKLLQAGILFEIHKSYLLSMGLFQELINESKEFRQDAILYYGKSAAGLGLPTEHRSSMLKLLKEGNKESQRRAAQSLAENAMEGDIDLVPLLDAKLNDLDIELVNSNQYQLNRSKYYVSKGDLANAFDAVEQVKPDSKLFADATFMHGVLYYRIAKIPEAVQYLSQAIEMLEKNDPQAELKSVAALTLARIQFQSKQYKEAFQTFLKVSKNNPLWPQAVMEQAWAQILTEDYEGAAGNMYTLHTDFFKNTFAPESYLVRAVGYLNLCQFGDGNKAVYSLTQRYQPMKDMLEQYQKKNPVEDNYYESVRKFLKNPQDKIIDGLHRNFVFEIARHPSFINEQRLVNSAEDQTSKYQGYQQDLVDLDKQLAAKIADQDGKAQKYRKISERLHALDIANAMAKISAYKLQQNIIKRVSATIKPAQKLAIEQFGDEKMVHKKRASVALKKRFVEMLESLTKILDQADLLNYELQSGAGEHLRYQHAGGGVNDKEHEELKVKDGKSLKWDFKGEVWEDELGHYRSSLKNVCPKNDQAAN